MRRRAAIGIVALVVLIGATPAAHGQDVPSEAPQPQVVGGSPASAGQFPWMAALVRRGADRISGFRCGATVVSRSWLLTAAHCVLDDDDRYPDSRYGDYVAPDHLDALTGTHDLSGPGGQRLRIAAIHPHPSHDWRSYRNDVALVRLARPTSSPSIAVIGSSPGELALDDASVEATVLGWGTTTSGIPELSTLLRETTVPVQPDATCRTAYPPGLSEGGGISLEYRPDVMVCAGLPQGGRDACQGDSGGPLAAPTGTNSWRQIGVVSYGIGCARPEFPGVYHRLASSTAWVARTRRFGPFEPDGFAFVIRQHQDFTGRDPTVSALRWWLRQLADRPAVDLVTELAAAPAWDGNAGMNVRLYRAAFVRDPDTSGMRYWVARRWAGRGPVSIANHFAASSEFTATYGALADDEFVTRIYRNVFDRRPDPGGRSYWLTRLSSGTSRGRLLYELSNSSEYRRTTDERVRIITTRFGLLRQVPTAGEILASAGLEQRDLIETMASSLRYASRFDG